jgi:hypothetical protein
MNIERIEHQESTNPPLLIASVGSSAYFTILGSRYIVVHASTMERALEWLEQAGYQWSSVEKITPTNIY